MDFTKCIRKVIGDRKMLKLQSSPFGSWFDNPGLQVDNQLIKWKVSWAGVRTPCFWSWICPSLPRLATDLGLSSISRRVRLVFSENVFPLSYSRSSQPRSYTCSLFYFIFFSFCIKPISVWSKGNSQITVLYLAEDRFPQIISQLQAPSSRSMLCPHFN